jgi:uncharacterized protein (TIGR02246 family)
MPVPGGRAARARRAADPGPGGQAQPRGGGRPGQAGRGFRRGVRQGRRQALAAFWTPDGDYTDQAGRHFKGREAIAKAFGGLFAENKGLQLRVESDSLKFVTPDVAVEDGTTAVLTPDGVPPSRSRYTIVHVKDAKDGKWYLSSVRDAAYSPPTNYDHLRELEWAIGEWADEADKGEVARASFAWAAHQNFIVSTFSTSIKGITVAGGTQWIGWGPALKKIRSWTFDDDGGFGESAWTREGDNKWVIANNATLRDGKKVVATIVVTRLDADTLTWQSRDRSVDGNILPDTAVVKMKRVK